MSICPQCQGKARRLIHSVPIIYKGSGFYTTDHGRGTLNNPGEKKEKAETETKSDTDTKSEEKG